MSTDPAFSLHVFEPDEAAPLVVGDLYAPAPDWTLLDFYLWHVRPKCLGAGRRRRSASSGTLRQYEIALWRWWQACTGWTAETLDPGDPFDGRREPRLAEITEERCDEFLDFAFEQRWNGEPVAEATVLKWVTHLNYCLVRTGPRIGAQRHFARVVPEAPQIERPELHRAPPPDGYTLEQIHELVEAAGKHARRLPHHEWEPGAWWRAVILVAYNTGARPETLFRIRWEDFPGPPLNPDGETPRVLDVPAEALKGRRNVQRIWLNDPAAEAIAPLRRPAGLVFGWPWPTAESTLRHELDRLRALAGIEAGGRRGPSPFYGFRRAFATQVIRIEHDAAPIAAAIMLNHKPPNLRVMLGHYADPVPLLRAVLPRLPQPGLPRQQLLF